MFYFKLIEDLFPTVSSCVMRRGSDREIWIAGGPMVQLLNVIGMEYVVYFTKYPHQHQHLDRAINPPKWGRSIHPYKRGSYMK